ncbi:polycystin family member [Anaeramoeba flamelloides]|uniref:Polycystin family member n=1 Tax=Anaeramoeba flamelloides TaxID=1746091 RepID=A0AAV7YWX8_9EUKA|nr:polycystin family member [Anaeramoeba flamelloides]
MNFQFKKSLRQLNIENAKNVYFRDGVVLDLFQNLSTQNQQEEIQLKWLDNMEDIVRSDSDDSASDDQMNRWKGIAFNREVEEQELNRRVDLDILTKHYEDKMWRTKLYKELLVYLIFFVLFVLYLFNQRSVDDCWEIEFGLTDLFFDEEFPDNYIPHIYKSFHDVSNTEEMYQWILGPMAGALEGDGESPPWLYRANVQVGAIRFRQLRVKPDSCDMPSDYEKVANSSKCYPRYKNSIHDEEPFGTDEVQFTYKSKESNQSSSIWGRLAFNYEGGGYVVDIPKNSPSEDFQMEIEKMQNNSFIDRATRAIVINIYMYNVNTNYFADIMPVFEFGPGGNVYPWYKFRVFRLDIYESWSDAGRVIVEILLFFFLIYYVIVIAKELKLSHKKGGVLIYFKDPWNTLDFFNILLFWIIFILQFTYLINSDRRDIDIDSDYYIPLSKLADKYLMLYNIIGFNVFMTIIKIFKFLQMNRRMLLVWDTLSKATPDLIVFFAFFIIIFIAFALMGFILFGQEDAGFRDFSAAITTCFKMSLGDIEFAKLQEINRFLGPIYFFLFSLLVIFTLMSMFLAIIDNSYDLEDMKTSTSDVKQLFATSFAVFKGSVARLARKLTCRDKSDSLSVGISTTNLHRKLSRVKKGFMSGKRLRLREINDMMANDPDREKIIERLHKDIRSNTEDDDQTKTHTSSGSESENTKLRKQQLQDWIKNRNKNLNEQEGVEMYQKLDLILEKIKEKGQKK